MTGAVRNVTRAATENGSPPTVPWGPGGACTDPHAAVLKQTTVGAVRSCATVGAVPSSILEVR
jgi:hypothetical protein